MRPEEPNPTAPTWNLDMGGRARGWACLTRDGRRWMEDEESEEERSMTKDGRPIGEYEVVSDGCDVLELGLGWGDG